MKVPFRGLLAIGMSLVGVLTFSSILLGQASDANLVGTVTDPAGAVVSGASVEATNRATNVKTTVTTNDEGSYRFGNLQVGFYDLTVTRDGFSVARRSNIQLVTNQTATANVTLEVGQVSVTVEVTESSPLIDTTTAQIGVSYGAREAIDTPLAALAKGPINLSLLSAGVASSGGVGLGEGPVVGGQRPRNNSFNIEGVDNNRNDVTGITVDVPNEAVGEVSVLLNQYSAEFGNGTGGQFNTTIRSGGNQIHGSLYEYFNNRNLVALDESQKRQGILSQPRFDDNRFGASVGGPVIKDKLFYYGLFEYNPRGTQGSPDSSVYAPTAAGYQTLSGMAGLSQTNLGVLKQYLPAAATAERTTSVNGVAIPIGTIPILKPSYTNQRNWIGSGDYNMGERDRFRVRYVDNSSTGFSESTLPALPAFFQGRTTTSSLLTASEFHTFTPTLTNEFRFGFQRYNDDIPAGNYQFPGLDVFPNITIENDLNLQLGPYDTSPQGSAIKEAQFVDNVTWLKGNHTVKFGADFRSYYTTSLFVQRQRGDYNYNTLERFLKDQVPEFAERTLGSPGYVGDNKRFFWFVNDDYKMTRNLTVNLGLRYEFKGIPKGDAQWDLNNFASVPGLITFRKPKAQTNAFVPRIGIAYSPGRSGKTSIRAGFGLAYDKYFDNLSTNTRPPQAQTTKNVAPPEGGGADFLKNGGIAPNAQGEAACVTVQECRDATTGYLYDQKLPYSIQWNFGIQQAFAGDYTLEIRYVGTRGVHLITQDRINVASVVNPNRYLPTFFSMPSASQLSGLGYTLGELQNIDAIKAEYQPYFDNNLITAFPYRGNSTYHGLQTELRRRFARNLMFTGAYTFSHAIDDSTADLFSTLLAPRRPEDFQNMRPERSNSFLDRRHRFSLNWVWDTTWFSSSSNLFLRNIVGNYTLSGTYIYETPQYMTAQSAIDANLNYDNAGDRVVINPAGSGYTSTDVNPIDRNGNIVAAGDGAVVAYVAKDPNAHYVRGGLGTLTNGGRMTLPSRPINNWDLQVKKAIRFGEVRQLQVSAQFSNLFNHPQYIPGYLNIVQFHDSNDTRNNLIPGNPVFNRPDLVYPSNSRSIQLVGRFQFLVEPECGVDTRGRRLSE